MIMTNTEHIIKALQNGIRLDGRKLEEWRPITIETGVSSTAEGSARVKMGDTEVIAGVKIALEKPFPDTPNEGVLMVNVELLPMSHGKHESGPPSKECIELARVIDRGIRESHSIDRKKLCVTPGEQVWSVAIDIIPINDDGNLFDIGTLAAMAALQTARFPKVVDGKVDYHQHTDEPLPIERIPIAVTICKIGENLFVDPTMQEQELLDARVTMTLVGDTLHAMQKGGDVPISEAEVQAMIPLVKEKAAELRKYLNK